MISGSGTKGQAIRFEQGLLGRVKIDRRRKSSVDARLDSMWDGGKRLSRPEHEDLPSWVAVVLRQQD